MRRIVEPVTAEAFEPYGQLLRQPGSGWRDDFAAAIANGRGALARPNFAMIRARSARFPLSLALLERHLHSSQAFLPLEVGEYLAVVCRDDGAGQPALATLRAFRVDGHSGVNYDPGIWHMGMATIRAPGTFAMFIFEAGDEQDCSFHDIDPVVLELAGAA